MEEQLALSAFPEPWCAREEARKLVGKGGGVSAMLSFLQREREWESFKFQTRASCQTATRR